jgi:hypothetical protein
MFTAVSSPTGHFTLLPIPEEFFETPSPFGSGALLVLNKFANNSAALQAAHLEGILIAAAQAKQTFGANGGACEAYGLTDRTGSEQLNLELSARRAKAALTAMSEAMGFQDFNTQFSNGLGERFADEYFQLRDGKEGRDDNFRGVACYFWESFSTATDTALRINVAFASPPAGGGGRRRTFLAALHLGRHRAQPASPFR